MLAVDRLFNVFSGFQCFGSLKEHWRCVSVAVAGQCCCSSEINIAIAAWPAVLREPV